MTAVETIQKHREDFLNEIKSITKKYNFDQLNIPFEDGDSIIGLLEDEVIWGDEFGNDYPMHIDSLSIETLAKIVDYLKQ